MAQKTNCQIKQCYEYNMHKQPPTRKLTPECSKSLESTRMSIYRTEQN